jgi:hypothetical protein
MTSNFFGFSRIFAFFRQNFDRPPVPPPIVVDEKLTDFFAQFFIENDAGSYRSRPKIDRKFSFNFRSKMMGGPTGGGPKVDRRPEGQNREQQKSSLA